MVALVRDADRYEAPDGVAVLEADLLDPPVTFPAVDAAYYLVHSLRAGGDFAARDRLAARTFVDGLRNTVVVTDRRIEAYVDVDPTPFDEAVRLALGDRAVPGTQTGRRSYSSRSSSAVRIGLALTRTASA